MTVTEQVIDIISQHLGVSKGQIRLADHLENDLNATRIEIADLIVVFEDKFKIHIPKEESIKLHTVEGFITYIADQLGEFE